jgi:hypothetical protein
MSYLPRCLTYINNFSANYPECLSQPFGVSIVSVDKHGLLAARKIQSEHVVVTNYVKGLDCSCVAHHAPHNSPKELV